MKRVTGIGGVSFKAKDAPSQRAWLVCNHSGSWGVGVQEPISGFVSMHRREWCFAAVGAVLSRALVTSPALGVGGPQFFSVSRGEARVYLLGFGEARDRSWLTGPIQRAFDEAADLWLEGPGPNPKNEDPTAKQNTAERIERLGRETGRTLFDALEPPVRDRTLAYLTELGIPRESVEMLRPWKAYYSIISGFMSKRTFTDKPVFPDAVLGELATASGKPIGYELPTRESFVNLMAGMSDREQSQYLAWLLDFLDDYKKGLNGDDETFGWTSGKHFPTRSLNRMRTEMPDLYHVMQVRRNGWWAAKIDELLDAKGVHFVAVGQLHVMGPDGIPRQLARRGVSMRSWE